MDAVQGLYISDYLAELRSQEFSSYIQSADAIIVMVHIGMV